MPTFVVKTAERPLPFEILYCNEAFRNEAFRDTIASSKREALMFRSWTSAIGLFNPYHEFADRKWAATIAGRKQDWKIVRAIETLSSERQTEESAGTPCRDAQQDGRDFRGNTDDSVRRMNVRRIRPNVLLGELPTHNLHARFRSIQTMMELSDVGVFEYLPSGKLIQANEAWYRLSKYPRYLPEHAEFAFMDLVHPGDEDIVMSAWNSLVQGNCVTFEMRWKANPGSDSDAQWVLSACIPVFDEDQNLVSIAGNTIDINGQKKLQEVQRYQIEEALEAKRQQEKQVMSCSILPSLTDI